MEAPNMAGGKARTEEAMTREHRRHAAKEDAPFLARPQQHQRPSPKFDEHDGAVVLAPPLSDRLVQQPVAGLLGAVALEGHLPLRKVDGVLRGEDACRAHAGQCVRGAGQGGAGTGGRADARRHATSLTVQAGQAAGQCDRGRRRGALLLPGLCREARAQRQAQRMQPSPHRAVARHPPQKPSQASSRKASRGPIWKACTSGAALMPLLLNCRSPKARDTSMRPAPRRGGGGLDWARGGAVDKRGGVWRETGQPGGRGGSGGLASRRSQQKRVLHAG